MGELQKSVTLDLSARPELPLSQGYVAVVDEEDYDRANQFKWSAFVTKRKNHRIIYARRTITVDGRQVSQLLHTFLTGNKQTDHRDGDGLNNRRKNLRPTNHSQNQANAKKRQGGSSHWRGVSLSRKIGKWEAQICKDRKNFRLGFFTDEADAALAYNLKAEELFGEFANFNTPGDQLR